MRRRRLSGGETEGDANNDKREYDALSSIGISYGKTLFLKCLQPAAASVENIV